MKNQLKILFTLLALTLVIQDAHAENKQITNNHEVVSISDVNWEQLNPARGDKSPQAGTLWGDRKGEVPTGFLVKFVDGFSSPPHIHNVTYRGVVISGLIHNDDPDAQEMWMPDGSFWTQPKGEAHITAAKGNSNIAYIEIDNGPYLVLPIEKAFDSGERPVNIDPNNIVWVDFPNRSATKKGVKISYLWGNLSEDELRGVMIKLPIGFKGKFESTESIFKAILIQGRLQYHLRDKAEVSTLEPGSYFGSNINHKHRIETISKEETILYIRSNNTFKLD